ncbi:MAG: OmpA family protein [Myxococcota bacterium]
MALLLCWPAKSHGESSRLNAHLEGGGGLPFAGDTRPGAEGDSRAGGGIAWISLDWQLAAPLALEAALGFGGFSKALPGESLSGTRYTSFGVGFRYRILDDTAGYSNEEYGNWKGNLWVSSHLGVTGYGSPQFGADFATGYEFSAIRPFSFGPFARAALALGEHSSAFFVAGLSFSLELAAKPASAEQNGSRIRDTYPLDRQDEASSIDSDGDGLSNEIEIQYGTDPHNPDTDGDGLLDGEEDKDHDGQLGLEETDPRRVDTDGGGVSDFDEVHDPAMDPRDPRDDRDLDADGILDVIDSCLGTPEGATVNQAGCETVEEGTALVLEGIKFASGSSSILAESEPTLSRIVHILQNNPEITLGVGGHTDSSGSVRLNRRLSEERAKSVQKWLVGRGVAESRLSARGYGSTEPIADNDTPEGRAQNRRIEFRRTDLLIEP